MSKLRAAHAMISKQAETIAIQQTAIESAHETKAATDAAQLRAEDESEREGVFLASLTMWFLRLVGSLKS